MTTPSATSRFHAAIRQILVFLGTGEQPLWERAITRQDIEKIVAAIDAEVRAAITEAAELEGITAADVEKGDFRRSAELAARELGYQRALLRDLETLVQRRSTGEAIARTPVFQVITAVAQSLKLITPERVEAEARSRAFDDFLALADRSGLAGSGVSGGDLLSLFESAYDAFLAQGTLPAGVQRQPFEQLAREAVIEGVPQPTVVGGVPITLEEQQRRQREKDARLARLEGRMTAEESELAGLGAQFEPLTPEQTQRAAELQGAAPEQAAVVAGLPRPGEMENVEAIAAAQAQEEAEATPGTGTEGTVSFGAPTESKLFRTFAGELAANAPPEQRNSFLAFLLSQEQQAGNAFRDAEQGRMALFAAQGRNTMSNIGATGFTSFLQQREQQFQEEFAARQQDEGQRQREMERQRREADLSASRKPSLVFRSR